MSKIRSRDKLLLAALAAVAVLPVVQGCGKAEPDTGTAATLDAVLEELVAQQVLPGAVALVVDDNKVVATGVAGWRDIADQRPMTEDTIFRWYSMSKPITSVAIMMLVEEGKLGLDQAVSSILPEFRDMRVYKSGNLDNMVTVATEREMTIEDLLLHTSGITYHFTGDGPVHQYYRKFGVMRDTPVGRTPEDGEPAATLDELVARLGAAPMLHQPGETFAYSYSTTVLGAVIERVSGQTLDVFLAERIFDPLGMRDAGFFVDDDEVHRFVTNYMLTDNGLAEIESPEDSDYRDHGRLLDGGGAIAGTAADYLQFVRMLANGGELDGVRLLRPETLETMFTPHVTIQGLGPPLPFGYGFSITDDEAAKSGMAPAGSIGWSGSGNTFFWLDPERRDAVVFMTQVIVPPALYDKAGLFRIRTNEIAARLQ